MQQDQQATENLSSIMKPGFAGTDAQKIKQEIQKDVSEMISFKAVAADKTKITESPSLIW